MYAMLCTRPDVCLATYMARGYKGDLGLDHQIAVKIVLRGIRKCFSVMVAGVKGYVDASFNTYPNDSE